MIVLVLILVIGFVVAVGLSITLFYVHSERETMRFIEQYPEAVEYIGQ